MKLYDVNFAEFREPTKRSELPQIYDLACDEMRDATQSDLDRLVRMNQVFGYLNPMNRALAALPAKVARGELTLEQISDATKIWTDMLGLDHNGR